MHTQKDFFEICRPFVRASSESFASPGLDGLSKAVKYLSCYSRPRA